MKKILAVLLSIFCFTLFAEIMANDQPILVIHNKKLYFPFIKYYSQEEFGAKVRRPTHFYDSSFGEQVLKESYVIHPIIRFGPHTIDTTMATPSPPSKKHWLGTDDHGRDVFVRLIYGLRLTLVFCISLAILGSLVGITIGGIQGYYGNNVDITIGRLIEIWCSVPGTFLLIIIASFMQPNFFLLLFWMLLFNWIQLAGITRTEFLRARSLDYIRAAEILGVSNSRIIIRHILPNTLIAVITYFPYIFNQAIIQLTSITFLGFGFPQGTPSLGDMLQQTKDNLTAPWIGIPTIMILVIILTFLILLGEKLRDSKNR